MILSDPGTRKLYHEKGGLFGTKLSELNRFDVLLNDRCGNQHQCVALIIPATYKFMCRVQESKSTGFELYIYLNESSKTGICVLSCHISHLCELKFKKHFHALKIIKLNYRHLFIIEQLQLLFHFNTLTVKFLTLIFAMSKRKSAA